jgi:hypothetical protein
VGLFTSYAPLANPKLAVVVITRGTDARRHLPAAVAGQIYRDLHQRFGTPTNLQISTTPDDEEKELAEDDELIADQNNPTASPTHKLVPETSPSNVKRVLNPINSSTQKSDVPKAAPAKSTVKPTTEPENRPRRTQENQP